MSAQVQDLKLGDAIIDAWGVNSFKCRLISSLTKVHNRLECKQADLHRVNQYRPQILNRVVVRPAVDSIFVLQLPNQANIVEVHRTCAAGWRRSVPGADANGDRVDVGQVYAECR